MAKLMLCAVNQNSDDQKFFNDCKESIEKHFGTFRFKPVNGRWLFVLNGRYVLSMHNARHYESLCNQVISAHCGFACDPVRIIK